MEAFEGPKDVLKNIQEKAKFYGKLVAKEAKKAVGIHVGKVSEANPRYYLVVATQGAMVRESIELDSPPVQGLRPGDTVTCVDISGRRARIIEPVEGWVSIRTESNDPILELTIAPDKQVQVAQMEKRFEKLKAQQNGSSGWESPTAMETASEPPSDSNSLSVNTMKTKLTFRASAETSLAKSEPGFIPKLNAPGTKKPPTKSGLPVPGYNGGNLLDLDSPTAGVNSKSTPTATLQSPVTADPFEGLLNIAPTAVNPSATTRPQAKPESESKGSLYDPAKDFDAWFG